MSSNQIKDKERDSIDFGKTKIEPLFHSIFYPTLLSMVFASLFTVADGIFGRREDLMMSWAERLGSGSSKRVC